MISKTFGSISPIFLEGYNCVDNAMASIMNVIYEDICISYVDAWRFDYIPAFDSNRKINDRLGLDNLVSYKKDSYARYYGFNVDYKTVIDDEFDELLLEGIPVPIIIDEYYCPWKEFFQKQHYEHCFTVTNKENGQYIGIDSIPVVDNVRIGSDLFNKGYIGHIVFCCEPQLEKNININQMLKNHISCFTDDGKIVVGDMLRAFSREVLNKNVFREECLSAGSIYRAPFLTEIGHLCGGRKLFLELINRISDVHPYNSYKKLTSHFNELVGLWNLVKVLVFKSYVDIESQDVVSMIFEYLNCIAEKEETICRYIAEEDFIGTIPMPLNKWRSL